MRRTGVLIALLSLAVAAPASAAFRPLEPGAVRVMADERRSAVIERAGGGLAVLDDAGPSPGLARPRCRDPRVFAVLAAVGDGRAVFDCGGQIRVVRLATGGVRDIRGVEDAATPWLTRSPVAIGRHWLEYTAGLGRETGTGYLNLRTGRVRGDRVTRTRRAVVPDLDAPALDRPLCRGIRRAIFAGDGAYLPGSFGTAVVHGSFALLGRGDGLVLRRCGSARERQLPADSFTTLAAGRLTWREGRRLMVLPLRRGARRTSLALPPEATALAQTRRRIFVSRPGGPIWVARAPNR